MSELVGNAVHEIRAALEAAMRDHADSYLRVGAILSMVKRERVWQDAGSKSFAEWVSSELSMSRAWAYQAIQVFEVYGERAKGIAPTRLQALLPVFKDQEADKQDELLTSARELNAGAFFDTIQERKGKRTTDSCGHSKIGSYCEDCGKKFKNSSS